MTPNPTMPRVLPTPRKPRPLPMSETQLKKAVIDRAHDLGWKIAHFLPAMMGDRWYTAVQADGKGWPDLVLVRNDQLLCIELKSERGKPTPEQLQWAEWLMGAGVHWECWSPTTWRDGTIESRLR